MWKGPNISDYLQIRKNLVVPLPLQQNVLSLPHLPPPLGSITFCTLTFFFIIPTMPKLCPQCSSCISWYIFHVTSSVDTISGKAIRIVYQGIFSSTNNAYEITGGPFWSTSRCVLSKEVWTRCHWQTDGQSDN